MPAIDGTEGISRLNRPWCLFRCGEKPFALGLESVCEVVEVDRLVHLPLSPPRVLGLCNFRREVVPVVALGGGDVEAGIGARKQLVVIMRTGQGHWAFRIAPEGTVVGQGALEGPAPVFPPGSLGPICFGTVRHGETSYAAIDPEATWKSVRERVEGWYADQWCRGASWRGESTPVPADPRGLRQGEGP
ncbi:MAG: chemotaxis protein CheW [Isosphaeraceae bacterium]